jgi:hypothetical protein
MKFIQNWSHYNNYGEIEMKQLGGYTVENSVLVKLWETTDSGIDIVDHNYYS